jgi:hypothetical protein
MDETDLRLMELVGWALAQGLWQVAGGEPLCTFAAWEGEHGREVARVDADSVAESVHAARQNLEALEGVLRWAIAVEGEIHTRDGRRLQAIQVEFGANDTAIAGDAVYAFERAPFQMVRGPILNLQNISGETAVYREVVVAAMHRPQRSEDGESGS